MLDNARRANPNLPWRLVWMTLGLIAVPAVLAVVVILLVVGTPSSGGATGGGSPQGGAPGGGATAGRCPAKGFEVAASRRPGAKRVLVPAGARSVRLCRYGPPKRNGLISSRMIRSQQTTRSLARELNAVPDRRGVFACPADIGPRLIAVFGYPAGADNPVTIDLSGCNPVSNGHVNRAALGRPVIGRIAGLVPPPQEGARG